MKKRNQKVSASRTRRFHFLSLYVGLLVTATVGSIIIPIANRERCGIAFGGEYVLLLAILVVTTYAANNILHKKLKNKKHLASKTRITAPINKKEQITNSVNLYPVGTCVEGVLTVTKKGCLYHTKWGENIPFENFKDFVDFIDGKKGA